MCKFQKQIARVYVYYSLRSFSIFQTRAIVWSGGGYLFFFQSFSKNNATKKFILLEIQIAKKGNHPH